MVICEVKNWHGNVHVENYFYIAKEVVKIEILEKFFLYLQISIYAKLFQIY
jgi:hypothetical protein